MEIMDQAEKADDLKALKWSAPENCLALQNVRIV
jgi:hypothetical protein